MADYYPSIVYTDVNSVVHLKFVESMAFRSDSKDVVIDKLRGDTILLVRTVSGTEYSVSMIYTLNQLNDTKSTQEEMILAIYDKWIRINAYQGK